MAHAGPGGEVLLGEGIAWMSTFGGHPARPGLLLPVRPNVTELSEWGFGLGSQGCCHCGVTLMQPVPFCTICLDRREGDDLACAITPALGFSKPVTCESPFVYLQSARKWYQCRVRLLQTLLFGHQAVFAEQRQRSCTICVSSHPFLQKPHRYLRLSTWPIAWAQRPDSLLVFTM